MPRKGFGSADSDTIYISIYSSIHNQLIRTFCEAHIVVLQILDNVFLFGFGMLISIANKYFQEKMCTTFCKLSAKPKFAIQIIPIHLGATSKKKVVHLADSYAKARPPPLSPACTTFLSPGTNLKSSKSFFCFVSRTFHYFIQFSSGNDYKPLCIWLKTEFSKLF